MTPPLSLQYQSTATLIDNKKTKTGGIDSGDSVEIQGPFRFETKVSVKEFLTESRFDGFGSPEERLNLLRSGGGTCEPKSIFFNPFRSRAGQLRCENSTVSGTFRSGPWAEGLAKGAQDDYEKRIREHFAQDTIPGKSSFTDPLRDALIQDPTLREDHLVSKLSKDTLGPSDSAEFVLDSARAFLRENPQWTMADLAELNRAMGNGRTANQLQTASDGEDVWTTLIARHETATIYLPTGKAADILKIRG